MPAEDIYQRRVDGGGTAGLPQAGADAFGAGIGDGLAAVGEGIDRIHEADREQARRSEALAAGLEAERAKAAIAKAGRERMLQPNGWAGHAEAVRAQARAEGERIAATITSRRVREKFAFDWGAYAIGLEDEADAQETVERGRAEIAGLDEQANLANGRLAANPTDATFGDTALALRESARATHAPPAVQDRYVAEKLEQFKLTQLDALPPEQAKAHLDSGAADAYLSPGTRRQIGDRIDARIAREASQAAAVARQAEAAENVAIDTAAAELDAAGTAEPGQWAALAARKAALGDTAAAVRLRAKEGAAMAAERYRGAGDLERDRRIATLEAKPDRSAAEGSELQGLRAQRNLLAGKSALDRAAFQAGTAAVPLTELTDAAVARRVQEVGTAQAAFGGVADFFLPGEAEPIAEAIRKGGADAKLNAAVVLSRAGPLAGRALEQVAGGDDTFRAAATLVTQPQGMELARTALRGPEALKARPTLLTPERPDDGSPAGPGWDQLWAQVSPMLSLMPRQEAVALKTNARNYYLSRAYDQGWSNLRPEAARRAMAVMLGARGDTGGFGAWRGRSFVLPRGMRQSDWDLRLSRARPWAWTKAAVNGAPETDDLNRFALDAQMATPVKLRDNAYALQISPNTYLMAKGGRTPFLFDPAKLPRDLLDAAPATLPELPRMGAH